MHVFTQAAVMIQTGSCIDYRIRTNRCVGLDHGARHDLHAILQHGAAVNPGGRMYQRRKAKAFGF